MHSFHHCSFTFSNFSLLNVYVLHNNNGKKQKNNVKDGERCDGQRSAPHSSFCAPLSSQRTQEHVNMHRSGPGRGKARAVSRRTSVAGRGVTVRGWWCSRNHREAQGSCLFSQMREQRPRDGEGLARGLKVTDRWEESDGSPGSQSSSPNTLLHAGDELASEQERDPPSRLTEPGPEGACKQRRQGANGAGVMTRSMEFACGPQCQWQSKVPSENMHIWLLIDHCHSDQPQLLPGLVGN